MKLSTFLVRIAAFSALCLGMGYTQASLAGDFYGELGVGYSTSFFQTDDSEHGWENGNSPGFYGALRYEHKLTDRLTFVGQYQHHSNWFAGPPFNDTDETSLDHIGVAIRFKLNK